MWLEIMHTFYVPTANPDEYTIELTGAEHHHLRNVLRLKHENVVRIIDGRGSVYTAEVNRITNDATVAHIKNREYYEEKVPWIMLFQAIPKNDIMELILQKTTELGVSQIVPLSTSRTLQKPSQKRYERWIRVVISATKQCKRTWLPNLCKVMHLDECLNMLHKDTLALILWEKEKKQHIKSVLRSTLQVKSIAFFIGPEGGFNENEISTAVKKGCIPVSIGSNTLRTETAAITSIGIAAYEYQL